MFSKRSLFVPAVLIFTIFFAVSAANAQTPACPYTLASLQGNYAIIGNYGANVAIALGARYLDGKGNLTATYVVNEPTPGSTTGERTIATGTQAGTYTVNCNGTGVITRILMQSNGSTSQGVDDFVITGAIVSHDVWNNWFFIATTIVDAQRTPSAIVPGGIFLTRSYTRLPDIPR